MIEKINIEKILMIARKAGEAILEVYAQDFKVESKEDRSPLTEADKRSNEVIIAGLKEFYPEIPVISEENKEVPYDQRSAWNLFWLVDPLDGTKEFVKRNGEFTVNIALINNGLPILGVVFVPVRNTMYYAMEGKGSFKINGDGKKVQMKNTGHYMDANQITVVASRSHLSDEVVEFVDNLKKKGKEVAFLSAGSSLKFCLVAEGKAHVYPRFGPTMEWDTGAAHAVVKEAGKKVLNAETGMELEYNKKNLLNPWFIVE